MGGRGARSQPTRPKDKWGIGKWENTKVGGVACKIGQGRGWHKASTCVVEDGGE